MRKPIGALLACSACVAVAFAAEQTVKPQFRNTFPVDKATLVATGTNRYFILQPGFRAVFTHGNATLIRTVLAETKVVDGIPTRVVEEREERAGKVVEIARDYYAIDPLTSDVYYFGEEVDDYKDGKVVGHGGAWLSGVAGAKFGLIMPGQTKVGDRFVNELAPGKAMDRSEIVAVDETIITPTGTFTGCLHVKDTTPLEPRLVEDKWYAPGVGVIKDAEFTLVKVEQPTP